MEIPARHQPLPAAPDNLSADDRRLLAALDSPSAPRELSSSLSLSPPALRAGVRRLLWSGLLRGPRATQPRQPAPAVLPSTRPATLNFTEGLTHECQGCGGCCTASDIGPISGQQVAALQAVDWSAEIPGLSDRRAAFQPVSFQGQTVYLTAKQQDTCVFLDADTRCRIHSRLGAAAKPLPCRQFPWRFTRVGDRIDVSLYAECRAWHKATTAGPAPAKLTEALADMIRRRPIPALRDRLALDGSLWTNTDAYLPAEERLIATIRGAGGDWLAPLRAYSDGVTAMLEELSGDIGGADAAILGRDGWAAAFPEVSWTAAQDEALRSVLSTLQQFSAQAQDMAAQRDLPWLAMRFGFLGRAAGAVGVVSPLALRTPAADVLRKTLADLLVSAIFGKEPARAPLRVGFARLSLRAWLTVHMAALRAREACRVQLLPQDLNDSMVTLSKLFREPAVEHVLGQLDDPLIEAFADGLPPLR